MPASTPVVAARVRPPEIAPLSTSNIVAAEIVTVPVSSAANVGSTPFDNVNDAGGIELGPSNGALEASGETSEASPGTSQTPWRPHVMPAGHSPPGPHAG